MVHSHYLSFMKRFLICVIWLAASCSHNNNNQALQVASGDNDSVPEEKNNKSVQEEVWIHFSEKTFVDNDFRKGFSGPKVTRRLDDAERRYLDSAIAGYFDSSPESGPIKVAACFWPKHGIELINSNSQASVANVCFECGKVVAVGSELNGISIRSWRVLFQRLNIPVDKGYSEYFLRAKVDSTFRVQQGSFQF